jgi:glycerophosphoryl diester phosphodiesterase
MKIIGHRGAKGLAPENTISGLKKGLEHGVDELEFDLRVTKDGVVILNHNPELTDASGSKLSIRNHTYAQLKAHKIDLATFEEILQAVSNTVPLLVEVKPNEPTEPIVTIIKKYLASGWKSENFLLGSFSQHTLLALHKELPEIEKVVIERWSGVKARVRANQVKTKRLNMKSLWLWRSFLAPMHKRGWQISPYTMNNPGKVKKWEKYLYGVITDFPDRFEK